MPVSLTGVGANARYDVTADVLYTSLFSPSRPATCVEAECVVLFRFDGDELVGMTIVDFAAQALRARAHPTPETTDA